MHDFAQGVLICLPLVLAVWFVMRGLASTGERASRHLRRPLHYRSGHSPFLKVSPIEPPSGSTSD
jgi:hypothetical protein